MKLAIITDTHAGSSSDNKVFNDLAKNFYDEIFFPVIEEYGIDTILHLGDILERRKYINFITLNRVNTDFLHQIQKRGLKMHMIPGNHDVYHKNTNEICGPVELWGNCHYPINFIMEPTVLEFDGLEIAMIPWINEENRAATTKFIKKTTAPIVFGHFELKGFEWYKGAVADHGDDPRLYERFQLVASGHYHHKSTNKNINYLGSPFQLTWNDYGDTRGFHIFDTETRTLEFIFNPFEPFKKIMYDDTGKTMKQMLDFPADVYKDRFIKIVVVNKTHPHIFDQLLEKLEDIGVIEVKVVEDHLNADVEDDEHILSEAEDTLTTLSSYIDMIPMGVDKQLLVKELHDIYLEAMTLQE